MKGHQLYKKTKLVDQLKNNDKKENITKGKNIADRASDRIYYEYIRTRNPYTGEIPQNIKSKEEAFMFKQKSLKYNSKFAKSAKSKWKSRGPFNVGGRTRALAIDLRDENIILAGGVSGGVWRSINGGESWNKTTKKFQNFSVTALVQDPRKGKQNIWYMGGGERNLGNSTSLNAPLYTGAGVHKSTDGGITWRLLNATADNSEAIISPFDIITRIKVNPINGDVYVSTLNGIYRSQNEGVSFNNVLATDNNKNTEIEITPSGRLYAFIEGNRDPNDLTKGIYTSINGVDWINISREEGVYSEGASLRSVFGVNPSNENEVYILTFAGDFPPNKLYRYTANKGKKWEDLTKKIPTPGRVVDGLQLQGGYNMVIKVHPEDDNVIFVGGTNLFRSSDRFETKENFTWIGGYSPKNDVSVYPNHHPDQHELVFFPSTPNKAISACDGGVFVTNNLQGSKSDTEPVKWRSLNNGYLTTQPYTVSFDPNAVETTDILSGFQDNGTWYSNSENPKANWLEEVGGDGSYNAIADNGLTRYSSAQSGQIFRINYNKKGIPQSFVRVEPAVSNQAFSFINPFILDPIDDNVMYLPAGRQIFRNSNLDELPISSDENTGKSFKNWELLNFVVESIPSDDNFVELNQITALDVSKYPVSNILYFGTASGQIYRLDNASLPSSQPVGVFENKGLPKNGFVSSITVDPTNFKRVIVTFSNYNIPSVFMTKDAGNTWIDISGNLEEKPDGTGNGPSVRHATFLGNRDGIIVGTSSGLFFAQNTKGKNTVWRKENNDIGNGVVVQIKTRKDGFAAAAVHGNGIFTKFFRVRKQPRNTLLVAQKLKDRSLLTTDKSIVVNIGKAFKDLDRNRFRVKIENLTPDFVDVIKRGNKLFINLKKSNLPIPEYEKEGLGAIRITAKYRLQEVSQELRISVRQPTIYRQLDLEKDILFSDAPSVLYIDALDLGVEESIIVNSADEFTIPKGEKWTIERIQALGTRTFFDPENDIPTDLGEVVFYKNKNGKPGEIVHKSEQFKIRSDNFSDNLDLVLPETVELTEGTYWISVYTPQRGFFTGSWSWLHQLQEPSTNSINLDAHVQDPSISFVVGAEEWAPYDEVINLGDGKSNLIFLMHGSIEKGDSNKSTNGKIADSKKIKAYPNPVKDFVTFIIPENTLNKNSNDNVNISINVVDITGKVIFNQSNIDREFKLDVKDFNTGVYFVQIKDGKSQYMKKIVKQ